VFVCVYVYVLYVCMYMCVCVCVCVCVYGQCGNIRGGNFVVAIMLMVVVHMASISDRAHLS
jgi:hypothetical protein